MRIIFASAIVGLSLTVSAASNAQAPAGSTGECKDGTYTTTESKRGACAAHGGVKDWYGTSAAAKSSSATSSAAAAKAAAPAMTAAATAPSGSTGQCKDGTYTTTETKKGACGGHGGVKGWYDNTTPAKATAAQASPASTNASAAPVAPAAPAPAAKASTAAMAATPAAGGGPGKVWVNTSSKVYHCAGTEWYGKTKAGEYMTESAAKAAGNHADHGKACS